MISLWGIWYQKLGVQCKDILDTFIATSATDSRNHGSEVINAGKDITYGRGGLNQSEAVSGLLLKYEALQSTLQKL